MLINDTTTLFTSVLTDLALVLSTFIPHLLGVNNTAPQPSMSILGATLVNVHMHRWPDTSLHGEPVEKRIIQTPDGRYDPNLVPPEWAQWLKQTRGPPPSPEEIQQCDLLSVQP